MSLPISIGRAFCPTLIVTTKSPNAIPVQGPLSRDAVIQTALDPAVTSIEYVRSVSVAAANYVMDGIVIVRDGARHVIELGEPGRRLRSIDLEGLRLLALETMNASPVEWTRDDVLAEPRCTNARLVWECASHRVRYDRRTGILDALECFGAIPLQNFDAPREDVFALACEAIVDIDLGVRELGDAMIRRSARPTAPRPRTIGA